MKILQQIYTRERRGLFRGSEGYDSIAKSPSLSDAFIKESVHFHCTYNPSRKLQSENAPADEYPAAYTFVRCPDGRALLGRAVYVAADFTGQRPTFFTHNYILPAGYELGAGTIATVEFLNEYDIALGPELPELDELPRLARAEVATAQPPCDRALFSKLVYCVIESLAGAKKVYVQAPVTPGETSRFALSVLETLYRLLPPRLTRELGFLTYSREPENKKGLNIIFLENGSVRAGDPRVARDFFIDASGCGGEAPGRGNVFPDFLWDAGEDLKAFSDFAEAFRDEMTAAHWDNLAEIYKIILDYRPKEECGAFVMAADAFLQCEAANPDSAARLAGLARQTDADFFAVYINSLIDKGADEFFREYASERLQGNPVAEARFWLSRVPGIFDSAVFAEVFRECVGGVIDRASAPFKAAGTLYEALRDFPVSCGDVIDARLKPRVDFENISRDTVAVIPAEFIAYGKQTGDPGPYRVLEILKKVSAALKAAGSVSIGKTVASYDLSADEKKFLLVKLREFYAENAAFSHFDEISELFKDPGELLGFVNEHAGSAEIKADFLVWAVGKMKIDRETIKAFISENLKSGSFKEKIHANAELKSLSRELRFGKLARFMT